MSLRQPPPGTTPGTESWLAFNHWCDTHSVPVEPSEDWQYLWECYIAAFTKGYTTRVSEESGDKEIL